MAESNDDPESGPANRDGTGRWVAGESGNRAGRPKIPEELRARIRSLSTKAVDALEQALSCGDTRLEIQSASILLDRGFGRPSQQTAVSLTATPAEDEQPATLLQLAREVTFAIHLGLIEAAKQAADPAAESTDNV